MEGSGPAVPKKAEAALLFKQKRHARQECKDMLEVYVACCRTHTFSTVWACRKEMNEVNACLAEHTSEAKLNELKRKWLAAGMPSNPDWDPYAQ
mmetsp:Transcript_10876/g.27917  ORF Transcript_10876/g.27917 Transcript_10876/m.27917 type:complete len:94 (-) Transcript_10876:125-406(-)|eukprot:jgi/Tetstr1/426710/TSEL_016980.t1